ncbi:MAG TPA: TetR family transcriptional regulator [Bryobacteraceae bacterium]|nr:TetR family transcriptional regulator [Bryobacteraceae bacterium]
MTETARAISTKDRILDAAERLFAEHGFAQTSLRDITAEAGVNLAAVNYHFQSKDHLIAAVFDRRIGPLNEQRLAALDRLESEAAGRPLAVEDLLRAVLEPVLRMASTPEGGVFAANLIGRAHTEPGDVFEHLFTGQFAPVITRVMAAARRSLPDLPEVELLWRLQFTIGAMSHTIAGQRHIKVVTGGRCDTSDVDGMLDRLITFVAAGCRAPVVPRTKGEPA